MAPDELLCTSLELQLEARDLPNLDFGSLSDPFAVLSVSNGDTWEEYGRTETIWDVLNPKWVRAFSFSPDTPLSAKFMVSVFDRDSKTQKLSEQDLIGSAEVSLQQVLDAGTTGVLLPLANKKIKDAGNVMIVGECYDEKDESHELFLGTCKFKNTSLFGKVLSKPYLVIYRRRSNNEWSPIFRSDPVRRGEDPAFDVDILRRTKIRLYSKLGSCEETPLRIELRAYRSNSEHKLIGAVQMSLGSLRRQALGKKISIGLSGESVGELSITRATLTDDSSSFDLEVSFCAK